MKFYIFTLISFLTLSDSISVHSKSTCNDKCLTKTYCLSLHGSTDCTKNNVVTAKWSVVKEETIRFTLDGKGIKSDEEGMILLKIQTPGGAEKTLYSCNKTSSGVTKAYVQHRSGREIVNGTSSYLNGVLSCTWTFSPSDKIYPLRNQRSIDLATDPDYQLLLSYESNEKELLVASNLMELPIYRYQYLGCCNDAHGTDDYRFYIVQEADTSYYLLTDKGAFISTFSLTDANGTMIKFTLSPDDIQSKILGTIVRGKETYSITDQLKPIHVSYFRSLWSHPITFKTPSGLYDTKNGVYDVQITVNDVVVYTGKGVHFKSSSSKLLSSSIIIFVMITAIFYSNL